MHDRDTEARAGAASNPHGLGLSCHLAVQSATDPWLTQHTPIARGSRSRASSLGPAEKPPPGVPTAARSLCLHEVEGTAPFGPHLTSIAPSGVTGPWPTAWGLGPRPENLGTGTLRAQQGLTASCQQLAQASSCEDKRQILETWQEFMGEIVGNSGLCDASVTN